MERHQRQWEQQQVALPPEGPPPEYEGEVLTDTNYSATSDHEDEAAEELASEREAPPRHPKPALNRLQLRRMAYEQGPALAAQGRIPKPAATLNLENQAQMARYWEAQGMVQNEDGIWHTAPGEAKARPGHDSPISRQIQRKQVREQREAGLAQARAAGKEAFSRQRQELEVRITEDAANHQAQLEETLLNKTQRRGWSKARQTLEENLAKEQKWARPAGLQTGGGWGNNDPNGGPRGAERIEGVRGEGNMFNQKTPVVPVLSLNRPMGYRAE